MIDRSSADQSFIHRLCTSHHTFYSPYILATQNIRRAEQSTARHAEQIKWSWCFVLLVNILKHRLVHNLLLISPITSNCLRMMPPKLESSANSLSPRLSSNDQSPSSPTATPSASASRRNRVQTACTACKKRKTKVCEDAILSPKLHKFSQCRIIPRSERKNVEFRVTVCKIEKNLKIF